MLHVIELSWRLSSRAISCAGAVRAAAGALSLANRMQNSWIDVRRVEELELLAGEAALNALVSTPVDDLQDVDIYESLEIWAD
jgi:hypothetical protein